MATKINQITEAEIGLAALKIAASKPGGVASFDDLRKEIPNYVTLTVDDRATSQTRPNEEMWEQKIRNLVSHKATPGNIIAEGYAEAVPGEGIAITKSGHSRLNGNGR